MISVDVKSGDRGGHRVHVLTTVQWSHDARDATQCHLLSPRQVTNAQYLHEQAALLKQVPSASDQFVQELQAKITPGRFI
jgi:hypothetical protein